MGAHADRPSGEFQKLMFVGSIPTAPTSLGENK